jgi:hypothetical protein
MKIPYKKVSAFVSIMLFWISNLFAQGPDTLWTKIYGGPENDVVYSVQQTADGGYIMAGYTESFSTGSSGYPDVYILKTDAKGDTLWTRTYGGDGSDIGRSVLVMPDKGYIIVGWTDSYGVGYDDVYLIRTDSLGDTLWTRTYGGINLEQGYSIKRTSDKGYIIAGRIHINAGDWDVYIIKTDSLGEVQWTKKYGENGSSTKSDEAYSIDTTSDRGYIISGATRSFGAGGYDIWLLKTDANGDTLWTRTYGFHNGDLGYSVLCNSDGEYVVAGSVARTTNNPCGLCLIKTDSNGNTIWIKYYGEGGEHGLSIQQIPSGEYIVSGVRYASFFDLWLVKVNVNGDTIWTKTYDLGGSDFCNSVQHTSDGGYIIAGHSSFYDKRDYDITIVKTDCEFGIEENQNVILNQSMDKLKVFPNPFCEKTNIRCQFTARPASQGEAGDGRSQITDNSIQINIYDIAGQLVKQLDHKAIGQSDHVVWDGKDNLGKKLPSGVYFVKLQAGKYSATTKVLMMR